MSLMNHLPLDSRAGSTVLAMLRPNIILSVFIIFSKFQAALCFRPAAQFVAEGVPANRSINQCVFKTKPNLGFWFGIFFRKFCENVLVF